MRFVSALNFSQMNDFPRCAHVSPKRVIQPEHNVSVLMAKGNADACEVYVCHQTPKHRPCCSCWFLCRHLISLSDLIAVHSVIYSQNVWSQCNKLKKNKRFLASIGLVVGSIMFRTNITSQPTSAGKTLDHARVESARSSST